MKIFSPYIHFTTEHGLPGVKVRGWHPAIFIPRLIIRWEYLIGTWLRYKNYRNALEDINKTLAYAKKGYRIRTIEAIIQNINCGYECGDNSPYGFVPEAGCPIHDI